MAVTIPYVRDFDFEYGIIQQVSPLIRRIVARNPGPFTFTGTGVYVIGHGEVAVIDPGPDLPEHFAALQEALAGERVTHVLVTHQHADHSPLAAPLARAHGCEVSGSGIGMTKVLPGEMALDEEADAGFRPDRVLADGEAVRGPGWTLEAVLTPGHTASHTCYLLHEENALFSGDHIMGWSTTVVSPPDGDMADYLDSLDKVALRAPSILWPTHGPPVTSPQPFIAAYRAHRLDREDQIMACLEAGHRQIAEMVPVMYAAVDQRLWPAAAHSVFAHLIRLVKTGAVACTGAPMPGSDYRLAGR
jgi:glyoxylase-like metal-dependent hydrolase (beta-lactamase superfamily II)